MNIGGGDVGKRFEGMDSVHEKMFEASSRLPEKGNLSGRNIKAKEDIAGELREVNEKIRSFTTEMPLFSSEERVEASRHVAILKATTSAILGNNERDGQISDLCNEIFHSVSEFEQSTVSASIDSLSLEDLGKGEETPLAESSYVNLSTRRKFDSPPLKRNQPVKRSEPKPVAEDKRAFFRRSELQDRVEELSNQIKEIEKEPWRPHLHIDKYRTSRVKLLKKEIDACNREIEALKSFSPAFKSLSDDLEGQRKQLVELNKKYETVNEKISNLEESEPDEVDDSKEMKQLKGERKELFDEIYAVEKESDATLNAFYEKGKELYREASPSVERSNTLAPRGGSFSRGSLCEGYVEVRLKHRDIVTNSPPLKIEGVEVSLKTLQDIYRSTEIHLNGEPLFKRDSLVNRLESEAEDDNALQQLFFAEVVKNLKSRGVSTSSITNALPLANQACFPHLVDTARDEGAFLSGKDADSLITEAQNTHYNFLAEQGEIVAFEVQADFTLKEFDMIKGGAAALPYNPSALLRVEFERNLSGTETIDYEKGDILFISWQREKGRL